MERHVLTEYWMILIIGEGDYMFSVSNPCTLLSLALALRLLRHSLDFVSFPKEGGSSNGLGMIQKR